MRSVAFLFGQFDAANVDLEGNNPTDKMQSEQGKHL